uniref:Integrase catalytic domain-containing protein n=4 Tax=Photinus pyralis TaxID=7054 RepID=A0A1Y1N1K0_PHOPY
MRSSSTVFTAVVNISYELFERFSTLTKLIRVLAWCRRFFKNCAKIKTKGVLTCRELAEAGLVVVKAVQGEAFQAELKNMKVGNASAAGRLLKLNPFLDDNNVIRVGGRLKNSQLSYNSKHPIVLPKNHKYVELLIKQEHARLLHAGAQAVLATIRTRYWILGGRDVVRRVLRKCIICFRTKPLNYSPLMGDLPAMRSNAVRPFYTSSVDYGGPFLIKDSKLRNRKFIKCYLCVFVCGVSKAVHLELATDLTASTFLLVLKRFIARRGIPKELYSDNGTNFVGAYNQLKNIRHELALLTKNEELQNFITKNNIEWHFMPANSPHMGGLHEAAVKSAKCLLYKLINNVHFTYEDFYTLLCQIEGVLNSRPLTTMSTDPNDYSVLTPGHFLIGEALVTIPEKEVTQRAFNSLKSYEKICRIRHQFWERWNLEYLTSLQERSKWRSSKGVQPKVGDPVLLMEEHRPPQMWTLGRITHLHPGSDGSVRVVSVKTPNSEVTRAVRKVCPLPLDVEQPFQGGEDVESDPGNQRRSLLRRSKNE